MRKRQDGKLCYEKDFKEVSESIFACRIVKSRRREETKLEKKGMNYKDE